MNVALLDYKAGNLTSVRKALTAIGADVYTPATPQELQGATAVIVPGVGHFAATKVLDREWKNGIRQLVEDGRPLLGICLGMQWLFEGSDEAPELPGLGIMAGWCHRLPGAAAPVIKIPHVGWNSLDRRREATIAKDVIDGAQVYFTHSYVAPLTPDTVTSTTHGEPFASVVQRGRVAGVQFHPEKSGEVGLRILRNFLSL